MRTVIISDSDSKTGLGDNLKAGIAKVLSDHGDQVQVAELEKDRVAPCLGCFRCATSHRGGCVNKDAVSEIKRDLQQLGLTVYLTPVVFGHFSSTVKNALDRGTGSHRWQIVIGHGTDIDDEERSTFIDLTAKHRGSADIVHPGMDVRVDVHVTSSLEQSAAICEGLRRDLMIGGRA